ncbi:MAG: glycosyltransferase family 2 protein [Candidatus Woesearchaeota archaeon]
MYKKNRIAVIIPAYNEEKLIIPTLRNVPSYFDRIYVVDDGSKDHTRQRVLNYRKKFDRRIKLVSHERNKGLGEAIITGYKVAAKDKNDVIFVVGGDFQMDLSEAEKFIIPIINNEVDFVKGNRFLYSKNIKEDMPFVRFAGNSILSLLTKFATGYWKIYDSNDGYTAIKREVIEKIDWDSAYKKYGYNGDWMALFNLANVRIKDVPRRPIYLKGERQSQIRIGKYIITVAPRLLYRFFWRIKKKYLSYNFHPLALFYFIGFIIFSFGFFLGIYLLIRAIKYYPDPVPGTKAILASMFLIMGTLFLLFALLLDVQDNEKLQP